MSRPTLLGLHGVAGAGKDTTFDRLRELGGDRFVRFSIADPMKESIAALLGVSLEKLEQLKRHPKVRLGWVDDLGAVEFFDPDNGNRTAQLGLLPMSMREFMQRYGTEAHRNVFGEDFWLDNWFSEIDMRNRMLAASGETPPIWVNTSVRFVNEAQRIIDRGGEVWTIVGPQDDGAAGHESETPLPPHLVSRFIDNSIRKAIDVTPGFGQGDPYQAVDHSHLDDQLALILDEWRTS